MPPSHSQSVLAAVCDDARADAPAPDAQQWSALFIVASPRPLTGKTFLARLIVEFLRVDGRAVEAFDLDPGETALAETLPALTVRAGLETTQAQMTLFDRFVLTDGVPKVVDLGHALFTRFFALVEEIGFIEEARRRAIETIVLFAADAQPASVKAYAELQRRFPATVLVPVFNEAILKGRRLREQYPFSRAAAVPLQIPALSPGLKAHADRSGQSFADFHGQLPASAPVGPAFELRSWTKRTFLEFRELELRLLMEKLRASLKG
ncbi:MAG: hypothetical protein ACRECO_09615 [Xanthobacteraceae bacterium]